MLTGMATYPTSRQSPRAQVSSIFLLLVCTLVSLEARAQDAPKPPEDILIFTNGDQLSGTLLRSAGGNVFFKSDMAGEISVPFSKVRELRTQGAFAVLKANEPIAVSR